MQPQRNAWLLILSALGLLLCFLSCSDTNTEPEPESRDAVLADNVVLLDEAGLTIASLVDSVLTLSYTGAPPDIEPGDILHSGVDAGLLCEVISVETVGSQMKAVVLPAWLPEMFHECDVDTTFTIASIDVPVEISFGDEAGPVDFTFGAYGRLSVTQTVQFRLRVQDRVLEKALLEAEGVCSLNLNVAAEASAGLRWSAPSDTPVEVVLGVYTILIPTPAALPIPIPITVLAVIPYEVWLEAEAGVEATFPVNLRAELRLGAKYDEDDGGYSPIFDPGINAEGGPVTASVQARLSAGAEIRPGISFQALRFVPGFSALRADLYLRPYVEGSLETDPLCWQVDSGINAGVFFQVLSVIDLELPELDGPHFALGNCVSDTTFRFTGHPEDTDVVDCQYEITMGCDIEYNFEGFRVYSINTMNVVMDVDYNFDFVPDAPPVTGSAHIVLSNRAFDLDFDHTVVQYMAPGALPNTIDDDWFNIALDLARDTTFSLGGGRQIAFIKGGETSHDLNFGTLPDPPHEEFGSFFADLIVPSDDYEFWIPWTFGYLFLQETAAGPPTD